MAWPYLGFQKDHFKGEDGLGVFKLKDVEANYEVRCCCAERVTVKIKGMRVTQEIKQDILPAWMGETGKGEESKMAPRSLDGRGHGTRWGSLVLGEASGQLDRSGTCVWSQ